MLEMGITFSFAQLILDHSYIDRIKEIPSLAKLPESINDPSFVKELVSAYRGDSRPRKNGHARPRRQKTAVTAAEARNIANEIIHTHRVPSLDRPTLNQLRRIIASAE
ncbi:MAG: hypothetical protein ACOX8R_10180 [Bacillota bacterium]|jgi:hypothetical protein